MSPSVPSASPPPTISDAAPSSSDEASADPAAATTRSSSSLQEPGPGARAAAAAAPPPPPPVLSAPPSQESFVSVQSSVAATREADSSNASQWTSHTDLTSPDAAAVRPHDHPNGAPPISSDITSPITTNGAKRTASGSVKNAGPSLPNTPLPSAFSARRPRTDSMSSTGSRAGDLALSLKTRLEYAMAKVQHGWENKNILEVEHLARHRASPNRHSMSHLDYVRRPMTTANGSTNAAMRFSTHETNGYHSTDTTPTFPPSKRHSGNYGSYFSSSQPNMSNVPRLQPAADIRPASSSQPLQQPYPSASPTGYGNVMSPPRTPVNGTPHARPPTIRTEMQTAEAEREALQALFQLGSPQGSQMPMFRPSSHASSSQTSPLRSEFPTPRKVTFARSESDSSASRLSSDDGVDVEAAATHQMVEV